ncbi:MAG: MBL fold metallo-hydrolase [Pseudomonadota bacterium]
MAERAARLERAQGAAARRFGRARRWAAALIAGAALFSAGDEALAFGACQAFTDRGGEARVIAARYDGAIAADTLAITYVTHSTFLLQTPGGASLATDYAGYAGPGGPPTAVTMNNAHSTHYTMSPDPRIQYVLRGWPAPERERAEHRVEVADLKVRNVSTDVRDWDGGMRVNGNSIFIFELGDLCVAHLGHLHHMPTAAHFAEIGFVDVVMAPVDGGLTLTHAEMAEVLARLEAKLVLPMHYFGPATLERFLTAHGAAFDVVFEESGTVLVSKDTLPRAPTMMVLAPRSVDLFDD